MVVYGLDEIHSEDRLHRNISSKHVYLSGDEEIVRISNPGGGSDSGARFYLPGELGDVYDRETEMWALGILLLEMATLPEKHELLPFNASETSLYMDFSYTACIRDLISSLLQTDPNKRPTT